jgi:hypothetical protein
MFAAAALLLAAPSVSQTRTAHDRRTGLIVHYPADWRRDIHASGFTIDSFPVKMRPVPMIVTPDGASIMISPWPEKEKSIDNVVVLDYLTAENGYLTKQTELQTTEGVVAAKEFRDQSAPVSEGHTLIDLFTVRGRSYETALFYRDAAYKEKFEKTYYTILSTLKFPKQKNR